MTTWLKDDRGNKCSVEKWTSISGFRGLYEISNLGRVRSLDRPNTNVNGVERFLKGKILKPSLDSEGYLQVGLFRNGRETKRRIHRIMGEAFILNDAGYPIVDHEDRNRTNNFLGNLRWVSFSTNRTNTEYALRHMKEFADQEAAA